MEDRVKVKEINPKSPADWLLLLRWYLFAPQQLKDYRAGTDDEGRRKLRQAVVQVVGILTYPLLILLTLLVGLQPTLVSKLDNACSLDNWFSDFACGVGRNWWVVPILLALAWVGLIRLDPLTNSIRMSGILYSITVRDILLYIASYVLGFATVLFIAPLLLEGTTIGLVLGVVIGLPIGIAMGMAEKLAGSLSFRNVQGLLMGLIIGTSLGLLAVQRFGSPDYEQGYAGGFAYIAALAIVGTLAFWPLGRRFKHPLLGNNH